MGELGVSCTKGEQRHGFVHLKIRISRCLVFQTIYKGNNLFLGLIGKKYILQSVFHSEMSPPLISTLVRLRRGVFRESSRYSREYKRLSVHMFQ